MLHDRDAAAGSLGDYFFQDLWAAKLIYNKRPRAHVDVGSRLDGFIAHLLTFMNVTVVDIRPLLALPGLSFIQGDATTMDQFADNSVESLSCLHAAEHFGLGRYGDRIDPDASGKVMRSLARVLAPNGRLYFSVPVGRERVEFNAHRIFSPQTVLAALKDLELCSISAVDESGAFVAEAKLEELRSTRYALGLFEFSKVRQT